MSPVTPVLAQPKRRVVNSNPSMDNDYVLNLDDILHTVETADVVRIRFQLLDRRLVIDNRTSDVEGPLIKLVNRSGSSEESFRNLKRLRPRFPLPERMAAIFWPKYPNTMRTTGVWSAIVRRIEATGFDDSVRQCDDVMREMLQLERQEIRNAISGEGFQTVWQRTAT